MDCDTLKASLESGAGVDELARKLVRFRFRVATDCLTACLPACLAAWLPGCLVYHPLFVRACVCAFGTGCEADATLCGMCISLHSIAGGATGAATDAPHAVCTLVRGSQCIIYTDNVRIDTRKQSTYVHSVNAASCVATQTTLLLWHRSSSPPSPRKPPARKPTAICGPSRGGSINRLRLSHPPSSFASLPLLPPYRSTRHRTRSPERTRTA